jgi:LPXTG-site transpeptidase (sortase) family protein
MPGRPGNVGVAAHRDSLFRGLRDVRNGDLIFFETSTAKHAYRVESTAIVQPEDVAVLNAGTYRQLTLVTCYPFSWFGSAPERFIVKAREVSPTETMAETIPVTETSRSLDTKPPQAHGRRIYFQVPAKHSRTLAPGISLGITSTDVESHTVDGWLWLMPDRRTVWVRGQGANTPMPFYSDDDGRVRKLVITHVSNDIATGYLQLPG